MDDASRPDPAAMIEAALAALARGPDAAAGRRLADAIVAIAEPAPALPRIAALLEHEDAAVREAARDALLAGLERWRGDTPAVEAALAELLRRHPGRPRVAEFVDLARRANATLLEQAYRRTIRDLTHAFERDGTIPRCPVCKSADVERGEGFYEFTEMSCRACGLRHLVDDYQLADWYPP